MEFVDEALPAKMIGMNSAMMCNYIKFCAEQLLLCLSCNRHFKIENPFEWMETISLQGNTNFFKNALENTPNRALVLIALTNLLPLMLAFDTLPPVLHHVTCYMLLCSSWNTHTHSHTLLLCYLMVKLARV